MIKQVEIPVIHNNKTYQLRGILNIPEECHDLVVMFHGYTGHKNENGYLFKYLSWELANLGIGSLRCDFMGSGDSDGYFKEMTFFTELNDARAIIEEAYKLNNYKEIIVLGFSMGGAVASRVSLEYLDKIKKLILLSPAGNMPKLLKDVFMQNPSNVNEYIDMGGYELSKKIMINFTDYDMYQNIVNFTKPVLIIHGECDQSVPISYSVKYHELYPNNEFYTIPDSPHCYTNLTYRNQVYSIIIKYLTKEQE